MVNWQAQLEELVETRRRALVGYAYVLTGDIADAEDLVHDAILLTFRAPRGLRDAAHVEAYVRRAITTQFLNRRRSHRRFVARMHLYATAEAIPEPATSVAHVDAVRIALQQLSPRERACVVLRHMEQYSVRELAEALGIAEGSAKRYLFDAAKKLEAQLGPVMFSDPDEPSLPVLSPMKGRGR